MHDKVHEAPGAENHDLLRLAYGAHPLVRDPGAVQFGLDASTAGIVEVARPTALVAALNRLREPASSAEALKRLREAGLGELAARLLLDDLLAAGILTHVPRRRPRVVVLGRSRLAEATCGLLHARGLEVRRPLIGESDTLFLGQIGAQATSGVFTQTEVPVLVIDRLAHSMELAVQLAASARVCLPVAMIDRRGIVGPLQVGAHGPCLRCFTHHRADADPRWLQVVAQQPVGVLRPDPVVAAYTAAFAAEVAQSLCSDRRSRGESGFPASEIIGAEEGAAGLEASDPAATIGGAEPGALLSPGGFATIGSGATVTRGYLPRHRHCPVCWAVSSGRIAPAQPAARRRISPP